MPNIAKMAGADPRVLKVQNNARHFLARTRLKNLKTDQKMQVSSSGRSLPFLDISLPFTALKTTITCPNHRVAHFVRGRSNRSTLSFRPGCVRKEDKDRSAIDIMRIETDFATTGIRAAEVRLPGGPDEELSGLMHELPEARAAVHLEKMKDLKVFYGRMAKVSRAPPPTPHRHTHILPGEVIPFPDGYVALNWRLGCTGDLIGLSALRPPGT